MAHLDQIVNTAPRGKTIQAKLDGSRVKAAASALASAAQYHWLPGNCRI